MQVHYRASSCAETPPHKEKQFVTPYHYCYYMNSLFHIFMAIVIYCRVFSIRNADQHNHSLHDYILSCYNSYCTAMTGGCDKTAIVIVCNTLVVMMITWSCRLMQSFITGCYPGPTKPHPSSLLLPPPSFSSLFHPPPFSLPWNSLRIRSLKNCKWRVW